MGAFARTRAAGGFSLLKRISAALATLLLASFAALYVAPRLDSELSLLVGRSVDELRSMLEGYTGLSISFESLSPSVFKTLSLSSLSVREGSGRVLLGARKVVIYVDPGALLAGKADKAVTELRLDDAVLDLRFPRDAELLGRIAKTIGSDSRAISLPDIEFSGKRLQAKLSVDGAWAADLMAREFRFIPSSEEATVSLAGNYAIVPALAGLGQIQGPIALQGSIAQDLGKARLDLSLAASSKEFELAPQKFELAYSDRELRLLKVRDNAPFDAEIRADLSGGMVSASLKLEKYVPSTGLRMSGSLAYLSPWFDLPYTGTIEASAPGGDMKNLEYELRLSGSLPANVLKGDPKVEIAAKGDLRKAVVEYARLAADPEVFEFRGSFGFADLSPDGELDAKIVLFEGRVPIAATFRVKGGGGDYSIQANKLDADGVVFRDLDASLSVRGKQLDFRASTRPPATSGPSPELPLKRLSGEEIAARGASPLISCEGNASLEAATNLELAFNLDAIDLAPFAKLIQDLTGSEGAAEALGKVKVGGELFATSDLERFAWSAPDLAVVTRSIPGAYALLSLAGNLETVTIRKGLVSLAGFTIEGAGKADFSKSDRVGFEAGLTYRDIPYAIKGSFSGSTVSLTGDYGLRLTAKSASDGTSIKLYSIDLPLPLDEGLLVTAIDADGRFATLDDWNLSLSSLSLTPTGEKLGTMPLVSAEGLFKPNAFDIKKIRIEDKHSALEGPIKLDFSIDGGIAKAVKTGIVAALRENLSGKASISLSTATPSLSATARSAGASRPAAVAQSAAAEKTAKSAVESYRVQASYDRGKLESTIDIVASPLARLGTLPLLGSLDIAATTEGRIDSPTIDFRAKLRDGRYKDQAMEIGASGKYSDSRLSISDFAAAYLSHRVSAASGSFSLADRSASVDLDYSGSVAGEPLSFKLSAKGVSTAPKDSPLPGILSGYSADALASSFSFGSLRAERWPFNARLSKSSVSIAGGEHGELMLDYAYDGSFRAEISAPFPVRISAAGKTDGINVDAQVTGLDFGLDALGPLIPPSVMTIEAGKVMGTARVHGLLADPEIDGEFKLGGVVLTVPDWLVERIGPFDAPVLADGRAIIAVAPAVKVGAATVAARAEAVLDHWSPSGLKGTLKSVPGPKVKLDTSLLGIHAIGDASLDLRAGLDGNVVSLDGDVTLDKAIVVVGPDVIAGSGGSGEPPSVFLSLDTNLRFGRGAQVFFPSRELPIVTGYAEPSSALAIRYDQAAEDFSMKGEIALRGGEVFYIQRNFFLKKAKIVFNENTNRFDPRVTLLAELRDRNDEGPVLVTLRADNAPIATFKPRMISDPPMTEAQIAELLGYNLFGVDPERQQIDIRHALISGSEFIPQLNVIKSFERKVRELLGLDIFYLRTQMLQRMLIDLSFAETDASRSLGRYLDETSAYAGKYLTDSIFAYSSARVRLSDSTLVSNDSIWLDLEAGVEFDTPFGLVQWSIAPEKFINLGNIANLDSMKDHVDNLFISDQSLSLTWKLSY